MGSPSDGTALDDFKNRSSEASDSSTATLAPGDSELNDGTAEQDEASPGDAKDGEESQSIDQGNGAD